MPPQQKDWWREKLAADRSLSILPPELADKVTDEVNEGVMTLEEAREIRLRLMEERKAFGSELGNEMENKMHQTAFGFCEH